MSEGIFYSNGIHGVSGKPLVGELTDEIISKLAMNESLDQDEIESFRDLLMADQVQTLGTIEGVDETRLEESGWGIVLPAAESNRRDAILEQLRPLLDVRRAQAGSYYHDPLRKIIFGNIFFQPFPGHRTYNFRSAQDSVAQSVVRPEKPREDLVYPVVRRVLDHGDLLKDDLLLKVYFSLAKF